MSVFDSFILSVFVNIVQDVFLKYFSIANILMIYTLLVSIYFFKFQHALFKKQVKLKNNFNVSKSEHQHPNEEHIRIRADSS